MLKRIPPWAALVAMVIAFIASCLIISLVIEPLAELILGNSDVPVPDGAKLELETDGGRTTSKEWVYSADEHGCDIARFYVDQGADCTFAPLACGDVTLEEQDIRHIATCIKTEQGSVAGYSWEVRITSGYGSGPQTKFRVLLYE